MSPSLSHHVDHGVYDPVMRVHVSRLNAQSARRVFVRIIYVAGFGKNEEKFIDTADIAEILMRRNRQYPVLLSFTGCPDP